MLRGPEFAATMGRLGIGNDTMVVGYDAEGGHHAARPGWPWSRARRDGGHEGGIRVDRGGTSEEKGEVTVAPARFVPHPREGVIATKEEVLAAVRTGDPWLLDVRRDSEFTGEEKRAARGGHIPGAVNILWKDALKDDWMLKDADELRRCTRMPASAPKRPPSLTARRVRAAFTHLVLTALGHDDVRTYDGSWEWGNDPGLPIIVGRS
jgi:thiosulfate/3-mercaptopyruvate sulfurtransferase